MTFIISKTKAHPFSSKAKSSYPYNSCFIIVHDQGFLVGELMKNSSFDDGRFISSGQSWREEDEKTMITYVSCCQEKEDESSFGKTLEDGDDDPSVWTPRSRNGEKREEGLSKTMMLTRPKGVKRYLCMDSEEMKACKDLGFELEEDKIKFEFDATTMPNVPSFSATTSFTSASNSSSNADWRISNPGDDPRDVKARLKLWAQAVAKASSSRRVRG